MTGGPYLYDDDPAPLHTGTPRRRQGLLLGLLGGTVAVAVGMAVALPLVTGSAEEQAREVGSVFVAALAAGDVETAHGLLCEEERARLDPADVPGEYAGAGAGEFVGTSAGREDDTTVQHVVVRWDDGTTTLTVVNENGPRVCGTAAGG